jgi:CheY-like chemotaxis protein
VSRGSRYRLVDRYTVHAGRAPFAARLADILPVDTEYLVLDLDRTVHLGVTIGEQLGWEILGDPDGWAAGRATTASELPQFFSARYPLRSLAGMTRGLRHWGLPGLFYAATVRLGDRWAGWDRALALRLGVDYVGRMQAMARAVLMASTAGYTREQLRAYAGRAWLRWQERLVIDAEAIRAIRERCQRLKAIVLSSASTEPTVEHAAAQLGVDDFVSSAVDVYATEESRAGVFSAPVGLPRWARTGRPPFFSRPGAVVHNSGVNKVSLLRVRHPELFSPGAVSVAISDNSYGEDRTWPNHFRHVVAINSRHPFSPFVDAASPCEAVHVLDAAPAKEPAGLQKRFAWHGKLEPLTLGTGDLVERFGHGIHARLETLRDRLLESKLGVARRVDGALRQRVASLGVELTEAIDHYNLARGRERLRAAREIRRKSRQLHREQGRLERATRESTRIGHELERVHRRAARALARRAV